MKTEDGINYDPETGEIYNTSVEDEFQDTPSQVIPFPDEDMGITKEEEFYK